MKKNRGSDEGSSKKQYDEVAGSSCDETARGQKGVRSHKVEVSARCFEGFVSESARRLDWKMLQV